MDHSQPGRRAKEKLKERVRIRKKQRRRQGGMREAATRQVESNSENKE